MTHRDRVGGSSGRRKVAGDVVDEMAALPGVRSASWARSIPQAISSGSISVVTLDGGEEGAGLRQQAGHRKGCATPSESLGKPPLRSRMRPVGGVENF